MTVANKIIALLEAVGPATLAALPPAVRQRLADGCRRVAALADKPEAPRSGVLADLRKGRGDR